MKLQLWFVYQLVFGYGDDFDLLSIVLVDIVCTMDILFYLYVIFTIISYFDIILSKLHSSPLKNA